MIPKTQKEFEKLCSEEAVLSFGYRGIGRIQLSKDPRNYGHSINPGGEFGDSYVSHSAKLKGFMKVFHLAVSE